MLFKRRLTLYHNLVSSCMITNVVTHRRLRESSLLRGNQPQSRLLTEDVFRCDSTFPPEVPDGSPSDELFAGHRFSHSAVYFVAH